MLGPGAGWCGEAVNRGVEKGVRVVDAARRALNSLVDIDRLASAVRRCMKRDPCSCMEQHSRRRSLADIDRPADAARRGVERGHPDEVCSRRLSPVLK